MAKPLPGKGRASHPRRRRMLLPALVLPVLAALAVWLLSLSPAFPRLEVAGFRITEEEYLRAMYQARNDVLSDHAAAGISLTDWHTQTPLGDPCGLTVERALELLNEYYAVGTLAVERGYLADASYSAMLQDLEEVNRQRREALESGAMITGIPQFTVEDFLTYRASNIRLQFFNDSGNPETLVTEEQLLRRYEADRDDLYRQQDSMELRFLVADGADDALAQAFEALRQRALETADLSAALAEHPELREYFQEISVTPETYGVYARSHGDILAWAAELQTGELSHVIRQDDRLCLIQCLSRTDLDYAPLEDVESIVAQSIRESRYDELIEQRMSQTEIRGDLQALHRFTAEQLP